MERDDPAASPHLLPGPAALGPIFSKAGYGLRLVGGCVRDHLTGRAPKDIDLCSEAVPDEVVRIAAKAGLKTIPTGIEHGTVTVLVGGEPHEITTLRRDVSCDGRHAEVAFTDDWVEDAARRDLTINSMSMDLRGAIFDPFGGRDDVRTRTVRFVGEPDRRIREDYLRILRFYRFATKFPEGGRAPVLDSDGLLAIGRNREGLRGVSPERVWSEIRQTIGRPLGARLLSDLSDRGVAEVVGLPVRNPQAAIDAADRGASALAVLAGQLSGAAEADALAKAWRMSSEEREGLKWMAAELPRIDDVRLRIAVADGIPKERALDLAKLAGCDVRALARFEKPVFPIVGDDLLERGWRQGEELGRTMKALRRTWTDSGFSLGRRELVEALDKEAAGRRGKDADAR